MTKPLPLLIFTDLDGTLLDHDTYSHAAADPVLDRLARLGAGVILASSKTAAEMLPLRAELGLSHWPAIVENGAGLLPEGDDLPAAGGDYDRLRAALAGLPPGFRGFGDMDVDEVADVTGLPRPNAALARTRAFTEPGLWTGSDAGRATFLAAAAERGIAARQGGRFLTLSFGATKADQMRRLAARFAPQATVALGDAPNDIEMIEAATHGIVIANPHGAPLPPLTGEAEGRIRRSRAPGPEGWAETMSALLGELNLTTEPATDG